MYGHGTQQHYYSSMSIVVSAFHICLLLLPNYINTYTYVYVSMYVYTIHIHTYTYAILRTSVRTYVIYYYTIINTLIIYYKQDYRKLTNYVVKTITYYASLFNVKTRNS